MKTLLLLALLSTAIAISSFAEDGFRPLFNGKDLTGWDGNPVLWSVEDGCISGKTAGPDTLTYNQFLIWRGGVVKNFELHAKIRCSATNTGIQYRSHENPDVGKWSVGGYQFDIHPTLAHEGSIYEERGRGVIVEGGQSVVIDPEGKRWLVAQHESAPVDMTVWHDYTIIAQGNHLIQKVDGKVTIDLVDHEEAKRSLEGILAFQLHRGPAMTVQVKDIMLKDLPEGGVIAFDKASLPADAKAVGKEKSGEPKAKGKGKSAPTTEPKSVSAAPAASADWKWIWRDSPAPGSAARLKKAFDLDGAVQSATLNVTCDNGAKVFLNGELVLTNPDWQRPTQADVTKGLRKGSNELLAEATNKGGVAAFVASLTIKMTDGSERTVLTDASWLGATSGKEDWQPVKVIAAYGARPWGDVFHRESGASAITKEKDKKKEKPKAKGRAAPNDDGIVTAPADIHTPPGFKVELIYTVPKAEQGSWVGLTVDDKGRLIATDQYGGLFRLTAPAIGSKDTAQVEKLGADITGAHGVLYAFDSIYAIVNEDREHAGIWRFRDPKGNGQFDEKTLIRTFKGSGEHGNHSLVLSPDGQSIYTACGNATAQPEPLEHTRLARPFYDDQVVPRLSKGGSFSDTEPHAFTCKLSPDGKRCEMIAAGMRNHFDVAFNALGDLFTYDSDMEWDAGTPWYRPTRIYQLVSGGDYGFRESSGKLLEYCPDIVPPLINVGPGSPTGMVSGQGAAFPAKYQHAIFACDWTYGALYAVHPTPAGAGYTAKLEEFITGKPLPLTDAVIGKDGAMYFAIGGRRTQSAVYRVTYVGKESTAPAAKPIETAEHRLRVELERLHDEGTGPEAIDKAWPHLGHTDRLVRYAARVAIERQPAKLWAARALQQSEPWAVIESAVALTRTGGREYQAALLAMLNKLDFTKLNAAQRLALVGAYELTISRTDLPEGEALTQCIARLDGLYPAQTNDLNRELSRTLIALGSPSAVAKTLLLMPGAKDGDPSWLSVSKLSRNDRYGPKFLHTGESRPNQQQIAYAYALRTAKTGWTPELRHELFKWFASTGPWQGGNQFRGFLDSIQKDALANAPEADRKALADLAKPAPGTTHTALVQPPKGPGKSYTVDAVVAFAKDAMHARDFKRGQDMFIAAACQSCHRLGNDGGGVGPDLTGAGSRYTLRDLLENIIEPSKVISDQYESTIIELKDGNIVLGRVVGDEGGIVQVAANPFAPNELTEVRHEEIKGRKPSPVSLMPPGLINSMNQDELIDLLAYILAAGDKANKMFTK